jgi:hypothetical protein
MRTLLFFLALGAFALSAAADTDVTGKWSGSFIITGPDGQTKDDTAYLVLKQNGTEITGTAGPNEDKQLTITKGRIDGNKISFEVEDEGHSVKVELALVADHITGDATMTGDNGETTKAKVDVTRVK